MFHINVNEESDCWGIQKCNISDIKYYRTKLSVVNISIVYLSDVSHFT